MSNLIHQDDLGNWGVKDLPWNKLYVGEVITEKVHEKLYGCLCKLKDYENTSLSPEQVEDLIEIVTNDYFREKLNILKEMNTLGYELTQIDGFSDDFLMWKSKDEIGTGNSKGFDGWDAVRDFVNNVHTLMNSYTVQIIKDRANGDYSIIQYGLFSDEEVQTALNCAESCKNLDKE